MKNNLAETCRYTYSKMEPGKKYIAVFMSSKEKAEEIKEIYETELNDIMSDVAITYMPEQRKGRFWRVQGVLTKD